MRFERTSHRCFTALSRVRLEVGGGSSLYIAVAVLLTLLCEANTALRVMQKSIYKNDSAYLPPCSSSFHPSLPPLSFSSTGCPTAVPSYLSHQINLFPPRFLSSRPPCTRFLRPQPLHTERCPALIPLYIAEGGENFTFQILDSCVGKIGLSAPSSLCIVVVPQSHPVSPLHAIARSRLDVHRGHDASALECFGKEPKQIRFHGAYKQRGCLG